MTEVGILVEILTVSKSYCECCVDSALLSFSDYSLLCHDTTINIHHEIERYPTARNNGADGCTDDVQ